MLKIQSFPRYVSIAYVAVPLSLKTKFGFSNLTAFLCWEFADKLLFQSCDKLAPELGLEPERECGSV